MGGTAHQSEGRERCLLRTPDSGAWCYVNLDEKRIGE